MEKEKKDNNVLGKHENVIMFTTFFLLLGLAFVFSLLIQIDFLSNFLFMLLWLSIAMWNFFKGVESKMKLYQRQSFFLALINLVPVGLYLLEMIFPMSLMVHKVWIISLVMFIFMYMAYAITMLREVTEACFDQEKMKLYRAMSYKALAIVEESQKELKKHNLHGMKYTTLEEDLTQCFKKRKIEVEIIKVTKGASNYHIKVKR